MNKKISSAKVDNARVSLKSSKIVLRKIHGKNSAKARRFLEELISEKKSIDGKYYTGTVTKILEVLKSAEANAKAKGMDEKKLFISTSKADKGRTFIRPRSRGGRRGEQAKMTHLEIVLEQR